jgi:hypothetical protein
MNVAVMVNLMMKCGYVMILDQCMWPKCTREVSLCNHHRMMKSGLLKTNMILPPLTMSMTTPFDPPLRRCRERLPMPPLEGVYSPSNGHPLLPSMPSRGWAGVEGTEAEWVHRRQSCHSG